VIENALITGGDIKQKVDKQIVVPVSMPWEDVIEKFTDPETLSFYQLIPVMRSKGGLTILKHQMQFCKMLATPFLFMVMVMVGACFAIRTGRLNKAGLLQFLGGLTGFLIYFSSSVLYALGAAGTLNVYFAACLPILLCASLSGYYLLHKEDG
jgi:lipopolysaccharide export system permease protein